MARGLPVILNVERRRCVVVGGGAVAVRRVRALIDAGADVTVVALRIDPGLRETSATCVERAYRADDLDGAALVVVASNDPAVNRQAAQDAAQRGVLVNRADDPDAGDVVIPAHAHHGPITIAVHTGGVSAAAAARIRDELAAALDRDWVRLLEIAAPFRRIIQDCAVDAEDRLGRLRQLTDASAMAILKRSGDDGLRDHLRRIAEGS